jgi:hypothetical protein
LVVVANPPPEYKRECAEQAEEYVSEGGGESAAANVSEDEVEERAEEKEPRYGFAGDGTPGHGDIIRQAGKEILKKSGDRRDVARSL